MFTLISRAGIAGALALAAGAPAAAAMPATAAAAAAAPVSVAACEYNAFPETKTPGAPVIEFRDLRIAFTNEAPLTATDVQFAVQYAGRSQVVDATGTFSSDASIVQDFAPSANTGSSARATCTVQSVTFNDGSTWRPV